MEKSQKNLFYFIIFESLHRQPTSIRCFHLPFAHEKMEKEMCDSGQSLFISNMGSD